MNRKSVIIKSNKYGLTVILDDKMPFQELLLDIAEIPHRFRGTDHVFSEMQKWL